MGEDQMDINVKVQKATTEWAFIAARAEKRDILNLEVAKVEKGDGADLTLVRHWIGEVQLANHSVMNKEMQWELLRCTMRGPFQWSWRPSSQ